MVQVNRNRELSFGKGLKYAEIPKVTGFDVKTVKKYIHQKDFNQVLKVLKLRPSYKKDIDRWLEGDRTQSSPLPTGEFDASRLLSVRTDSYAKFTLGEGKHIYSSAPPWAHSSLLAQLTAYDVIVRNENQREIVRHPRLYGKERQESMDWLPYLNQLENSPAALKYTGTYDLLPEEIQSFLDLSSIQGKEEVLKVLATLDQETDFT